MNEKIYSVYCHINKINSKIYIGITSQHPCEKRWLSGHGYHGSIKFHNAIKKYGWRNFDHLILFENLNEDIAKVIEIELINKYDTVNGGYNITNGGEGRLGIMGIKSPRAKVVYQFDLDGNLIKKWDCINDAARYLNKPASQIHKACKTDNNQIGFGYIWSYTDVPKNIKIPETRLLSVRQYSPNGTLIKIWDNLYSIKISTNFNIDTIKSCCNDVNNHAYNYIWIYQGNENTVNNKIKKYNDVKFGQKIYQYNLQGELLNIYNNANEIKELYGYTSSSLSECCNGISRHYKNSIWLYEKDIDEINNRVEMLNIKKSAKKVKQLSLSGELLRVFENSKNAGKSVDRSDKSIASACSGITNTCANFKWEYC